MRRVFEVLAGLGFFLSQFVLSTETPSFGIFVPPERAVEDKGNEGVKGERSGLVWHSLITVNGWRRFGDRLQRQFPRRCIIARRLQGDGLDRVRLNGREPDGEGLGQAIDAALHVIGIVLRINILLVFLVEVRNHGLCPEAVQFLLVNHSLLVILADDDGEARHGVAQRGNVIGVNLRSHARPCAP